MEQVALLEYENISRLQITAVGSSVKELIVMHDDAMMIITVANGKTAEDRTNQYKSSKQWDYGRTRRR